MTNSTKISIVTVCYNAVDTIEKTILSVVNQTYDNIEYIIIDGASTDGTVGVINKYRDRIAKIVSEPDKGIYDAMNKSIQIINGDWVIFLNSDDVFYSETVLSEISNSLCSPNTIYYGDVLQTPINNRYDGSFNKWKLSINNICHQSIFYPKSVFNKYSYNTNYKLYADWDVNLKCMGDDGFLFVYINQIISVYDMNGLSSSNFDPPFWNDYYKILTNNLGIGYALFAYVVSLFVIAKRRLLNMKGKE